MDEATINKYWVLFHLEEAHEELTRTIKKLPSSEYSEEEFGIAMQHLFHHLNTAWNSRYISHHQAAHSSKADFDAWREFPSDISMG